MLAFHTDQRHNSCILGLKYCLHTLNARHTWPCARARCLLSEHNGNGESAWRREEIFVRQTNPVIFGFYAMLSSIPGYENKSTPAYKMQEFPVVCLIKIWRPAVLPSLSPQCAVGSLQPLYFSRSYLDAQKKKRKEKERESETEFFHSEPVDILVYIWS